MNENKEAERKVFLKYFYKKNVGSGGPQKYSFPLSTLAVHEKIYFSINFFPLSCWKQLVSKQACQPASLSVSGNGTITNG